MTQTAAAQQLSSPQATASGRFEPASPTTAPRFAVLRSTANAPRARLVPVPHGTVNRHRSKPQPDRSRTSGSAVVPNPKESPSP